MKTETIEQLEYAMAHTPVLYFLHRSYWIFWSVKNLDGDMVVLPSLWKKRQQVICGLYNQIYLYGYRKGLLAALNSIKA